MPTAPSLALLKNQSFMPGTFRASAKEVPNGLAVVRRAVFGAGRLYVADRDADCVRKYDAVTGAHLGVIAAPGLIDKPIHLVVRDGILFAGNRGNESVVKCDLHSEQVAAFIHPKAGGLNNPSGLAFGDDGYIHMGSRGSRQVLRFRLDDGRPDQHPFIDRLDDEPQFIAPVSPR